MPGVADVKRWRIFLAFDGDAPHLMADLTDTDAGVLRRQDEIWFGAVMTAKAQGVKAYCYAVCDAWPNLKMWERWYR